MPPTAEAVRHRTLRIGGVAVVGLAFAALAFYLTRTDYEAAFESATGVALPEGTETVASCGEWGVRAAVFSVPAGEWASLVHHLRSASPDNERARRYSGLLCDSVLPAFGAIGETATVPGGEHEGVVWALNERDRLVLWEVWY